MMAMASILSIRSVPKGSPSATTESRPPSPTGIDAFVAYLEIRTMRLHAFEGAASVGVL